MTAVEPRADLTASLLTAAFPVDGLHAFASPEQALVVDGHLAGQVSEELADAAYEEAALTSSVAVHQVAVDPGFREAVGGDDAMLDRALGNLVDSGADGPRNRAFRRDAELAAKYWQRYCAKTELGAVRYAVQFQRGPGRVLASEDSTLVFGTAFLEELEPAFEAAGRRDGIGVHLCAASLDELNAGEYLAVLNAPVSPAASGSHTPRATVGRVVTRRAAWHTTIAECGLAEVVGPKGRYFAARRWRAELGLPERVFVTLAADAKPLYVDFTSPIFTAVLCTALRACSDHGTAVTITEALPGPEHAWARDAQGHRYVSELRIT
ncbi:hypothetical protein [Allokutzneria sp. NRRL B-24872]|uniref:hypothetical protein n=1 Tax=Allokutzneria sp. NRRL B-24872 TaxID=1137961 RepID=UPI000A3BF9A0|nr:hypothetical protein [Allokutzneria sp. NRRL B-24872]